MRYFLNFLLEPISYLISMISMGYYALRFSDELRHKILSGYFLVASLLVTEAIFFPKNLVQLEIYPLLCLLAALSFSAYFYLLFQNALKKKITLALALIQLVYFIFSSLVFKREVGFDSMAYVILSTCVVVMIFMYVHQLLNNITIEPLTMNFDFWVISSQLIYFLGSFIIFLSFDYITRKFLPGGIYQNDHRAITHSLWGVHNVLLFLSSILTGGSIVWIVAHKKLSSS